MCKLEAIIFSFLEPRPLKTLYAIYPFAAAPYGTL